MSETTRASGRKVYGDHNTAFSDGTAGRRVQQILTGTMEKYLKYAELYLSLQGEGKHQGWPCFFIRTAVCDLRCSWCDTPDALTGGKWISRDELLGSIPGHVPLVQITGGEPLLQKDRVVEIANTVAAEPYNKRVLLETGGHRSIQGLPASLHVVMDIKLPSSGETDHDFESNLEHLKPTDEIKFVIANEADYQAALEWCTDYDLAIRAEVLFSPVSGGLELKDLANWILRDRLPVRLQTQLHKHIWGRDATGV